MASGGAWTEGRGGYASSSCACRGTAAVCRAGPAAPVMQACLTPPALVPLLQVCVRPGWHAWLLHGCTAFGHVPCPCELALVTKGPHEGQSKQDAGPAVEGLAAGRLEHSTAAAAAVACFGGARWTRTIIACTQISLPACRSAPHLACWPVEQTGRRRLYHASHPALQPTSTPTARR